MITKIISLSSVLPSNLAVIQKQYDVLTWRTINKSLIKFNSNLEKLHATASNIDSIIMSLIIQFLLPKRSLKNFTLEMAVRVKH